MDWRPGRCLTCAAFLFAQLVLKFVQLVIQQAECLRFLNSLRTVYPIRRHASTKTSRDHVLHQTGHQSIKLDDQLLIIWLAAGWSHRLARDVHQTGRKSIKLVDKVLIKWLAAGRSHHLAREVDTMMHTLRHLLFQVACNFAENTFLKLDQNILCALFYLCSCKVAGLIPDVLVQLCSHNEEWHLKLLKLMKQVAVNLLDPVT